MSSETLYGNCHVMPLFSCVLQASKLCLHPHRTACSHGSGTDVIPPLLHPPTPSVSVCLRAAGPYSLCVTGRITQQQIIWRGKTRTAVPSCPRGRTGGHTGLYFDFRGVVQRFLKIIPSCFLRLCGCLTADLMVLSRLVWLKALRPGGHLLGGRGEKTLCPRLRLSSALWLWMDCAPLLDFLQSLWVICGRRWRTEPICFPYPPSIPSLLLVAGKSLQWGRWWGTMRTEKMTLKMTK